MSLLNSPFSFVRLEQLFYNQLIVAPLLNCSVTDWWDISGEIYWWYECSMDNPFITGFYRNSSNSLIKAKCCNAMEEVGSHCGTWTGSFKKGHFEAM